MESATDTGDLVGPGGVEGAAVDGVAAPLSRPISPPLRDGDGALAVRGRSWQEDGTLSARYWSEAAKERKGPAGVFYYFGTANARETPMRRSWRGREKSESSPPTAQPGLHDSFAY